MSKVWFHLPSFFMFVFFNFWRGFRYFSLGFYSLAARDYSQLPLLQTPSGLRGKPHLRGEKLARVEGSLAYPRYLGRANFSFISLQNLVKRLHEKQKVGSTRRVTSRVTLFLWSGLLPSRTIFSPYKHFGSPSRVNSVKARQSEHARALLSLGKKNGVKTAVQLIWKNPPQFQNIFFPTTITLLTYY